MECKICGRERQIKYFPRRKRASCGIVIPVCEDCTGEADGKTLAKRIAPHLEISVDIVSTDGYVRVV